MGASDRIYRRTDAGLKAWESQSPGVPPDCRRILGLVAGETHLDLIRARLRRFSDAQIDAWLAQLERLRMLESAPMAPDHDLDFTGRLSVSELLAKRAS